MHQVSASKAAEVERLEERKQWREEQQEDREFEKSRDLECQRREDLVSERDLWAGTVQMFIENSTPLHIAVQQADKLIEEYRQRYS